MMERKGERISVRGIDETSDDKRKDTFSEASARRRYIARVPCVLLSVLFSFSKPDIRSSPLLPCSTAVLLVPGCRSPRWFACAENVCVLEDHLECFRITEVTDRISE
jgi:hypothetical protein